MYYRLTVKRDYFNYEEFFAAKTSPTLRQLIKYYNGPDREFGEMSDMVAVVKHLLSHESCELPTVRKNIAVGSALDAKGRKYHIILKRLDLVPLSEILDGK